MNSLIPRRTLMNAATVEGRGLFTGEPAIATFLPAPVGTGIVFKRIDLPEAPSIPATLASLSRPPPGIPPRNTTLRSACGSAELLTVEHVLAALMGLGVSDAIIEVRGPELPIGDGSAAPFTGALWAAGLRYAGADIEPLRVDREIVVTGDKGARITARPRSGSGCLYTYELDYGGANGAIPAQAATFDTARGDFIKDIAPARTFCTEAEAEAMTKAGLFAHLDPRDVLIIAPPPRGPNNPYRFENEPARHKVLDLVGDLGLAGRPIQGEIIAHKSGHALNHKMAKALVE